MTELSFLVDLLLNHKLTKSAKDLIVTRIKEVEQRLSLQLPATQPMVPPKSANPFVASQSPSTQALLAKHPDLIPPGMGVAGVVPPPPPMPEPAPVANVAQTPAAVAAVNARNESISLAMSGKPAKGETRPRKF